MRRRLDLKLDLRLDAKGPIYLSLAASIIGEVERGRLKPGDALPGTRALAHSLKVHRNTVDAAYHELILQGWIYSEPSRGTFVARDLPEIRAARKRPTVRSRLKSIDDVAPVSLIVSDGTPDPRIMPSTELGRSFRRALSAPSFLSSGYGDPRGASILRDVLSNYLATERGLTVSPDDLLVTRGSQMGLYLSAATIIEQGQAIAVEDPGYPLAWEAFRMAGARVIGVPVDEHGIDLARLEELTTREPSVKAVYVTPHHQYPTTVTLGAGRRIRLLDIARRLRLTIIEDDYDHEYRFDGRPVLPLAARSAADISTIYIGSLSKLLAPAVRLGYVAARTDIIARMAYRRQAIDRQGDMPLEYAVARLIDDGELGRHARKARRIYQARRDILVCEILEKLADFVSFEQPAGGLALWLKLNPGYNAETWAANAARAGLSISPALRFLLNAENALEAFRVGYANLDEGELKRLVVMLLRSRPLLSFAKPREVKFP